MTRLSALAAISAGLKAFKAKRAQDFAIAAMSLFVLLSSSSGLPARSLEAKQKSLDEWRSFTSPEAPLPKVFVKGEQVRFFFPAEGGAAVFTGHWRHLRVPTEGYKVHSALLSWEQKLPRMPEREHGWREATVVAGSEWRRLTTNLFEVLAPKTPLHGAYYQAFLADGLVYRGAKGTPRFAAPGVYPTNVVVERRYSTDETLQLLARQVEDHLVRNHPGDTLFVLMAPSTNTFAQPLLLDRRQRRCVCLSPAALYDVSERGVSFSATAQGFSALLPESHGLALIKNPVSSVFHLADVGVETVLRFFRMPLPRPGKDDCPLSHTNGMDLAAWEKWLDTYTGTRREEGSLRLLLDGDQFFPRFQQAVAAATNHIHAQVYIFDRDDVAVSIADQLKQRSRNVEVKVIMDRLGSVAAGNFPPPSPMPEDFVCPSSISGYLGENSEVRVRSHLNPWFWADHSKVLLVDGPRAWLGGMNLGHEYRYDWHDLMVEVEGPVVASLEHQFRRDWAYDGMLGDLAYAAAVLSEPQDDKTPGPPGRWMKVRRLPTKTGWKPFAAAVSGSIRRAQSYIYLENPYLFDKRIVASLVRARHRGVDVRVVLPRVNDFKAGARSNLVTANYLTQQGVRVFFYPAMTHVKALLVDDWACVGSGNLNHLSLHLNQEQNIATSDPGFAAHLKSDLFEQDFARSYELTEPVSVDWVDFFADTVLDGF